MHFFIVFIYFIIYLFVYLFIYLFIYLFVYLFIYLFIYLLFIFFLYYSFACFAMKGREEERWTAGSERIPFFNISSLTRSLSQTFPSSSTPQDADAVAGSVPLKIWVSSLTLLTL